MALYDSLFYNKTVNRLFSEKEMVAAMVRFELALLEAQVVCGVIPLNEQHVQETLKVSRTSSFIQQLNITHITEQTALSGNPAIPFVKELISVVKKSHPEVAKYLHNGATSQDVIDTAMILQVQKALFLIEKDLKKLQKALKKQTIAHRNTLMIGRTLLQQAKPITFGLKTALCLDAVNRSVERLEEMKKRVFVLQLGGAVGNLGGMNGKGLEVVAKMSEILGLNTEGGKILDAQSQISNGKQPPTPNPQSYISWHTSRDRIAEIATNCGILVGSLGKIAKDIQLLMQTEVAEVFEGAAAGKGGSSTMPHKRNPVTSTAIVANVHRMPHLVATILSGISQEHERSAGLWHAEWAILPEILMLTAGVVARSVDLIENLEVDAVRMSQNLEATNGLIFAENVALALATEMGKTEAHHLVEQACKTAVAERQHLKTILSKNEIVSRKIPPSVLEALFDAKNSIGLSLELIDRVLDATLF